MRILREMTKKGEVPLRTGVDAFLDAALAEGARIAVVASTASVPEDGLVSSAMLNLGPNRWAQWCECLVVSCALFNGRFACLCLLYVKCWVGGDRADHGAGRRRDSRHEPGKL